MRNVPPRSASRSEAKIGSLSKRGHASQSTAPRPSTSTAPRQLPTSACSSIRGRSRSGSNACAATVEHLAESAERQRAEHEAEVAQRDVEVVTAHEQVDDDPAEPRGDDVRADTRP